MAESVDIRELNILIEQQSGFVTNLVTGMNHVIVGQRHLIDSLLISLLSDGHILLEGVPGLAKTLAIKTLAQLIDADFSRIQFTPDLLPADVIGTMIYSQKDEGFHVKKGPVWDKDNMIFNYVLHPYGGAAYYMSARGQGYNTFHSALYSAAISTFFWEYGIEAFMEIPSIQDLIITPIAGAIIGEGFYILKRKILENDYRFIGSKALGKVVIFLIDPVNSFIDLFRGSSCKRHVAYTPWMNNGIGFSLSATF